MRDALLRLLLSGLTLTAALWPPEEVMPFVLALPLRESRELPLADDLKERVLSTSGVRSGGKRLLTPREGRGGVGKSGALEEEARGDGGMTRAKRGTAIRIRGCAVAKPQR